MGFQLLFCSLESVALDELLGHTTEHQTGHHAHRRGAGAEALARLGLVVVLQRLDADSFQPVASPLLQLGQFHVAFHQGQQVGHLLNFRLVLLRQTVGALRERRYFFHNCLVPLYCKRIVKKRVYSFEYTLFGLI